MTGDASRLVRIGKIARAHGIRGEVTVYPDVEGSSTLLEHQSVFLRLPGGNAQSVQIDTARPARDTWLVRFKGCENRQQAESMAGQEVLVPYAWLPALEPGEYYAADLVGLKVKTASGESLGKVEAIFEAGAAPVLEITGVKDLQVPLASNFVKQIDLAAGEIIVEPPEVEEVE